MSWSSIDIACGYYGGEETVRFGPRHETGSSLYQVDTAACISSKSQPSMSDPWIVSAVTPNKLSLAIENQLCVFDETCAKCLFNLSLDSVVDAIGWNSSGKFLACACRGGKLSFIHAETGKVLLVKDLPVKKTITQQRQIFASVIFVQGPDGLYDLLVIAKRGDSFRFSCMDLKALNKAILDNNLQVCIEIQAKMKISVFDPSTCHGDGVNGACALTYMDHRLLLSGSGEFCWSSWSLFDKTTTELRDQDQHHLPGVGFRKCFETPDKQYLIALGTDNHIVVLSGQGYFCFEGSWKDIEVDDFILFASNSLESETKKQAVEDLKLVLLTKPCGQYRQLKVYSVPSFEHVYTLQVSACSALATAPAHQEFITFIEGVAGDAENLDDSLFGDDNDHKGKDQPITTVRIRCLSEAVPENRFYRLLNRKKFDEAEQFAKVFDLDMQLVHKFRSSHILNELSPWGSEGHGLKSDMYNQLIVQLKECLDKVDDVEHVVTCCLKAQLPTLKATYDLLNYAREKVNFAERKFTQSSGLLQQLLDGLNKLVTFEVANGVAAFTGEAWSHFLSTPLLDEVIRCFGLQNFNSGITIWRRHQSEFESHFTYNKLETILRSIRPNTPSAKIIPWLREDFVPFVLTVLPDGQEFLADWLEGMARGLEITERSAWPGNALEMAEVMFSAFSSVNKVTYGKDVATPSQFATKICKLTLSLNEKCGNESPTELTGLSKAMAKLGDLAKSLREVYSLHRDFNCKLSLDQFNKEDNKTIVFRLLDRVAAAELISSTVKNHVKPYAAKNALKLSQLLYDFVVEKIGSSKVIAPMWEPKIISVIKEIDKIELRCSAILQLMSKARTPWSAELEALVAAAMEAYPDNEELLQQFKLCRLRKMFAQYGIKDTNVSDRFHMTDIIWHIFSSDIPTALEDVLQISEVLPDVTTATIYFMRVKSWIIEDKAPEAVDLLKRIPVIDAVTVLQYIQNMIFALLSVKPFDEENKIYRASILSGSILCLEALSAIYTENQPELTHYASLFKKMYLLMIEFSLFVSVNEFENESFRIGLVQEFLRSPETFENKVFPAASQKKIGKSVRHSKSIFNSKLCRFAELLDFSQEQLNQFLVEYYEAEGDFSSVFLVACYLMQVGDGAKMVCSSNANLSVLYQAAYTLLTSSKCVDLDWVHAVQKLQTFLAQATALCTSGELRDFLVLSQLLHLATQVANQCVSSGYQDSERTDGVIHDLFNDHYNDDGLVLDWAEFFPLLKQLVCLAIAKPTKGPRMMYKSSAISGRGVCVKVRGDKHVVQAAELFQVISKIVGKLQDNNHQALALQFTMLELSLCTQHASNLEMGIPVTVDDSDACSKTEQLMLASDLSSCKSLAKVANEDVARFSRDILASILNHRFVDHDLALAYLDVFSTADGFGLLRQIKNMSAGKFNRIQLIAKVGVDFAALRNEPDLHKKCNVFKDCAFWGRKLEILRIAVKDVFALHTSLEEKENVLTFLVSHKDCDLQMIKSFCEAFSCDVDEAILMHIKSLLIPSERVLLSKDLRYQDKINEAISRIDNKTRLEKLLNSSFSSISPYDYERLAFVFRKVADITSRPELGVVCEENIKLLEILDKYQRTADPAESEIESCAMSSLQEEEQILRGMRCTAQEVGRRLPFQSLMKGKPWKILEPEICSEQSVTLIKPIVHKLKLDPDQLRITAIHNIVNKVLGKDPLPSSKQIVFAFDSIKNTLLSIQNPESAVGVAKWVARKLPNGAEKAKALQACVELSKIYMESAVPEDKEKALKMHGLFTDLHQRVSTEAVLLEYDITDDKYMALCSQPAKLILELYSDYGDKAVLDTGKITGVPAIHDVAGKVAAINKIELSKVHHHLLEKWLPSVRLSSVRDDDANMSSAPSLEAVQKENEKNLVRAIYVLAGSFDLEKIDLLLYQAFENKHHHVTNMCRVRALKALFTLVNPSLIAQRSGKSIDLVRERLIHFIYLSELESLHIAHTEESFKACNKEALIKSIWRHHSHEPEGVRLIADLCLDYRIYDPKLWNSLLLKLLSYGLMSYLKHVLVVLSAVPELREIPCLTKMWRAVIMTPLTSATFPLSAEDEASCLDSAQLLRRCPVILDIGLPEIAKLMQKAGLYTQSIACLKLIPDHELRSKSIQVLLDDVGHEVLLGQVKKEREKGGFDSHLDSVEEEIFSYIDANQLYMSMYRTPYWERFLGYLIRSQRLNNILISVLRAGRPEKAAELVGLYLKVWPHCEAAVSASESNLDPMQALWVYLHHEGILNETKQYVPLSVDDDITTYAGHSIEDTIDDLHR